MQLTIGDHRKKLKPFFVMEEAKRDVGNLQHCVRFGDVKLWMLYSIILKQISAFNKG